MEYSGTGQKHYYAALISGRVVGGMITTSLLSMFVIQAGYYLMRRPRRLQRHHQ